MKLKIRAPRPGFPWSAPTAPDGIDLPEEEPTSGAHYDTAWARKLPARYARFFILEGPMRAAVKTLADPIRVGTDRLDAIDGPAIFAANHHSHLDAPLLLTSIPGPWRHKLVVGGAADYFFRNRFTSAASALAIGAFPIERSKVTRRATDQASDLLAEGWSLLIFPEGGRSPDGWGQGHRGGAAYLSARTGVPVVPVHLQGTNRIFAKGDKRPRPGTTKVTFGSPLRPTEGENATRFAARIEAAVATLADEAGSDWWTSRKRAAAGTTPSLTGPGTSSWRRAWALGDRRGKTRRSPRWPEL
ncbi:MAG: 1-acyl-sn-glycerol-3-phosphate acyltransferase [Actinomycetia bacterium]|nr:1-acyl-sn-glycerol-3-phosphate acyltransferase [Actinomycetes bacterium]